MLCSLLFDLRCRQSPSVDSLVRQRRLERDRVGRGGRMIGVQRGELRGLRGGEPGSRRCVWTHSARRAGGAGAAEAAGGGSGEVLEPRVQAAHSISVLYERVRQERVVRIVHVAIVEIIRMN